jgi:two-component system CheB/CheR fusion protein
MARDGLRTKLRMATRQAVRNHGRITVGGAQMDRDGATVVVSISAQPIESLGETLLLISFSDEPERTPTRAPRASAADLPHAAQLEAELDATRTELESAIRDLELSNDELTATNEEAMSVNEELQSTNEELTTSKEEMQSMNEELQTLNTELQVKVEDHSRASNDMKNLLDSTEIAVLFLDDALNVRRFTPQAAKLIKLIPGDIGRPLSDLATDLRYPGLGDDAQDVLRTLVFKESVVSGRGGRRFSVRVMPYRTSDNRIDGLVITFTAIPGKAVGDVATREETS